MNIILVQKLCEYVKSLVLKPENTGILEMRMLLFTCVCAVVMFVAHTAEIPVIPAVVPWEGRLHPLVTIRDNSLHS